MKGEIEMDEIKVMLDEEIKAEIEKLNTLDAGSDEKSKAVEDLTKLYKLKIEEQKAAMEQAEQLARRKEVNADRIINIGLQVGLAVGGWIVYDVWHRRGLKFEEEGTITSPWTRNLMSKMFPKK